VPFHKSAEKAVRKTARRTSVNKARLSRIRTFVKKVELSLVAFGKDPAVSRDVIKQHLSSAEKELMRGASRGILHKNNAARKVSRLTQKAKKILDA
jgi:small subunit ribosomal protein S20